MLEKFNIKNHIASIEHPQTNKQAKKSNGVLLKGLKWKLKTAKWNWTYELPHVLWAYKTAHHSTTNISPLCFTYGTEAFISIEVNEMSWRATHPLPKEDNNLIIREEINFSEEKKAPTTFSSVIIKQDTRTRHNRRV